METYPTEVRDGSVYVAVEPGPPHQPTVSDVMVETMVNWGVNVVFGMVGHSNLGFADALRRQEEKGNLRFFGIRHEGAASFAASAYGKLTGKPAVELEGEVIDPKCYFGVVKPGLGKPHRSCAIRCISGGIPPMLAVKNENGESNYYVLLGKDGEPINKQILDYVADRVKISGKLEGIGDWLILKVDLESGIKRIES